MFYVCLTCLIQRFKYIFYTCLTLIKKTHIKYLYLHIYLTYVKHMFKGGGPGINSSQSKNVGKIQLSMQLSHLSIIFENIWLY